ncbi:SufE family protein [Dysgonomonas sp. HDW5B]|uniref:SufE family protein n=1 Tax=Dysgonomonas sp. HDW5B TaxID=2714927 RepID=UPI00140C0B67|nr:SufE family protein [Dysgonomonas sp. HDW5B]QIK56073.1 SufE family protein [Dysgonomonas sp. HDW5B]
MTLQDKQNEFIDMFNSLGSWQERFQYLIDSGSELPEMPEHIKVPATRITSCSSKTFFYPSFHEGVLDIQGWSNSAIPSGLIAIIKEIFAGSTQQELLTIEINFHTETKLLENLTGLRAAGLLEMIERFSRV